jgi:hypothetical protein
VSGNVLELRAQAANHRKLADECDAKADRLELEHRLKPVRVWRCEWTLNDEHDVICVVRIAFEEEEAAKHCRNRVNSWTYMRVGEVIVRETTYYVSKHGEYYDENYKKVSVK